MDTALTGMHGEAFVLTRLLSWGYPATLVSGPLTYDIVVDIDGHPYRVQVKATDRKCDHGMNEKSFSFHISGNGGYYETGNYDILACVALPSRRVLFLPFTDKKRIRRKVSAFTEKKEKESWEDCLDYLNSIEKKN